MAQGSQAAVSDALLARARALGQLRVIVTLRVPEAAPVSEVEAAKSAVLAAIARTPHRVVRELGRLPQLVLDASEESLRALASSPHVLRVDESRPSRPQR